MFLLLIATVFHTDKKELNTLVPGIAGLAIMATTFSALAFNLTFYREQGILKRILGAPLPRTTYFGGIIGSAGTKALVQGLLGGSIGHPLFDGRWPQGRVALFVFTLVRVGAGGALGIPVPPAVPKFG